MTVAVKAKRKKFTPKIPELLNEDGFMRIRRGIWEHVKNGRLTANDFCVYMTLHDKADWKTGICYTTAGSLASNWGNFNKKINKLEAFQNAMQRLRDGGYIDYPEGVGKTGSFPVLIDKYEPTRGPLRGWRLRLLKEESDYFNPWYQYVSPTPFKDVYGDIEVEAPVVVWREVPVEVPVVVPVDFPADFPVVSLPLQDVIRLIQEVRDSKLEEGR